MLRKKVQPIVAKTLKGIFNELSELAKRYELHHLVFADGRRLRLELTSKGVLVYEEYCKTTNKPMKEKPVGVIASAIPSAADIEIHKEVIRLKLLNKYEQLATQATFTNDFIHKCKNLNKDSNIYKNGVCSNTFIAGKVITVERVLTCLDSDTQEDLKNHIRAHQSYDSKVFSIHKNLARIVLKRHREEFVGVLEMIYERKKNEFFMLINEDKFIAWK
ncbi:MULTISPECIES: hypothetical protein [Vibrio]|uniref:hypothetical protein n=1 Tax=Vibrio TaxID=662 RepID=UPI00078CDC17|nr:MULTISPECIES: hypothetical protein [Vibrio]BAU70903.1 hypothetical protein [Vibrio sp. 04Ya108]BBM67840.1 hypothetical protein VA249_44860 [Vibrio alfacsensis]BCN27010.1 hypothetical protein VYA_42020 [Vibrio alfacsensis]